MNQNVSPLFLDSDHDEVWVGLTNINDAFQWIVQRPGELKL